MLLGIKAAVGCCGHGLHVLHECMCWACLVLWINPLLCTTGSFGFLSLCQSCTQQSRV